MYPGLLFTTWGFFDWEFSTTETYCDSQSQILDHGTETVPGLTCLLICYQLTTKAGSFFSSCKGRPAALSGEKLQEMHPIPLREPFSTSQTIRLSREETAQQCGGEHGLCFPAQCCGTAQMAWQQDAHGQAVPVPLTGRAALSPRTPIPLGVEAHHHHRFLKQILSQYEVVFHVLRQNKCKIKLETI